MAKKPVGRPSLFTPEIAAEISERLSAGEPLAQICRDEHMPAERTVRDWTATNEAFSAEIARARDAGHDAIAMRARLTARGKTEEDGGDSSGDVQRDKLIIDTDLKLLAKWNPKKYGDKVAVVGGNPDDAPVKTAITVEFVKPKEA